MIRDFVVETSYAQEELPEGNTVSRVVVGECGKTCAQLRFGGREALYRCPNLVNIEWAKDPREGMVTADLRTYSHVVCADTVEARVALELMLPE